MSEAETPAVDTAPKFGDVVHATDTNPNSPSFGTCPDCYTRGYEDAEADLARERQAREQAERERDSAKEGQRLWNEYRMKSPQERSEWAAAVKGWKDRAERAEAEAEALRAKAALAIRDFVARVNARAEAEMMRTGKLEGAHHRAIEAEYDALTATPPGAEPGEQG